MPANPTLQSLTQRLKFKHLVLLDCLERTRNMHRAAEQMSLTQPAATKILRYLEDLFGFPLFERLPRSMVPTDLGAHVVRYAQQTLNNAARFAAELDTRRAGGSGTLLIGAIMGAADILAMAIARLKEQRPLLTIKILEQTSDQLLVELEEQRLDMVIGRLTSNHQHNQFNFQKLAAEPYWAVVNASHPLRKKRDVRLSELGDWAWVLQPITSPMRQYLESTFARAGIRTPGNVIETTSVFATLHLVQTSQVIAVLPKSIVARYVRGRMLGRLPIDLDRELDVYGILTRRDETLSAVAQEFMAALRAVHNSVLSKPGNSQMISEQAS